MDVKVLTTPGLGDKSYVLAHDGIGVIVDPQRDIDRFRAVIEELEVDPRYVLETHLHNDYVSGGRHLAAVTGADLVLPAGAGTKFAYLPAFHLEDLDAGPFQVRPLHTPGHTPEHVSYLVLIDDEPLAVFSGGSLLVGSAGRSDLLGMDRATSLVRLQYRSVMRLAELPEEVDLYPTHGAGSFCTASEAGGTTSTIGEELKTNPVLHYRDSEDFASGQLTGLPPYPSYYAHMGPMNLAGPDPYIPTPIPEMSPAQVEAAMEEGVLVVDARYKTTFAAAHIAGSWGMELGSDFATWIGWLLPFDAPMVLILEEGESLDEARDALARIGFENIRGVMWGLDAWVDEGKETVSHATMTARQYLEEANGSRQVVDVRAPTEWADGTLDGAILCHLPDLIESIPEELDPQLPVYLGCTTGHRASIAAGVLADEGYEPVVLTGASLLGVIMLKAQQTSRV
ncbi:MAG: rhodanese-like domain-containing protein [Acidimicrobiia bacterium]|jgi:glyoxylase-like metal-dependent hydrolase (beta-lactamase superfamily II)/rhodanese-related sulfurtransferase